MPIKKFTVVKTITKNVRSSYFTMYPDGTKDCESVPLVVYLHPAGIRESRFVPFYSKLREDGKKFVCLSHSSGPDIHNPDSVKVAIDAVCENHPNIDRNRIYIAGFSMGARGAWDFAFEYPHVPAAMIVVSGFGSYLRAHRILDLPVSIVHGKRDFVVPFEESEKMYSALQDAQCTRDVHLYSLDCGHEAGEVIGHDRLWSWIWTKTKAPVVQKV